jgi:hypothetical protein
MEGLERHVQPLKVDAHGLVPWESGRDAGERCLALLSFVVLCHLPEFSEHGDRLLARIDAQGVEAKLGCRGDQRAVAAANVQPGPAHAAQQLRHQPHHARGQIPRMLRLVLHQHLPVMRLTKKKKKRKKEKRKR